MAALLHRPPAPDHRPRPARQANGLAYAAIVLASLASLALQPGPGDGGLQDEPLLSLAAWARTAVEWIALPAEAGSLEPADR